MFVILKKKKNKISILYWFYFLYYLFLLTPLRIKFSITPTTAAKLSPDIEIVSVIFIPISIPYLSSISFPTNPIINIDNITIMFFQFIFTFSILIVFTPTRAIIENNIKLIPPITDDGIVLIVIPNLEIKLSIIAKTAANLKREGS